LSYHRFKIAQTVALLASDISPSPFMVVRLLQPVGGEPRYRVDSTIDGHQRTVMESQIRPMPSAQGRGRASVRLWLRKDDEIAVGG
jgi:hypothetical protein